MAVNNVAVIGAGIMGAGVARNILKGVFNVAVFDLDGEAVVAIARDGARAAVPGVQMNPCRSGSSSGRAPL